jgi:hypothetical protein
MAVSSAHRKNAWMQFKRGLVNWKRTKITFREGDIVRVPGERGTAAIRAVLHHVNGVLLEKHIGGFRRWNQDEIKLVRRGKRKQKKKVRNS